MEIVPATNIIGRPNSHITKLPSIKPILTKHGIEQGFKRAELVIGQAFRRGHFEGSDFAHVATRRLMPNRFLRYISAQ